MSASLETLLAAVVQQLQINTLAQRENTGAQQATRVELAAVLAELRGDPSNPSYPPFLAAIADAFPRQIFSSAAVVEFCHGTTPTADTLRAAVITALGAVNAALIGKFFQRVEGYRLGDLQMERVLGTKTNAGVCWKVVTVEKTTVTADLAPGRGRT